MIEHITSTTVVAAHGNKPKQIEEFIGRINSGTPEVSVARMRSPEGWMEPGQRPEFDEYSIVLHGMLRVETENGTHDVTAGQAIIVGKGEWVKYSTPLPEGAEYMAICLPAFSPETVYRDAEHAHERPATV
ncbi:MAG: cupin [Lentisphaerae bacterium]|nr:cupin [Lentisphaerota bacterium]